jgi:hypothetical protein
MERSVLSTDNVRDIDEANLWIRGSERIQRTRNNIFISNHVCAEDLTKGRDFFKPKRDSRAMWSSPYQIKSTLFLDFSRLCERIGWPAKVYLWWGWERVRNLAELSWGQLPTVYVPHAHSTGITSRTFSCSPCTESCAAGIRRRRVQRSAEEWARQKDRSWDAFSDGESPLLFASIKVLKEINCSGCCSGDCRSVSSRRVAIRES